MTSAEYGADALELVADGFSFPSSLTFDEQGSAYIGEAGVPFGGARPVGRVWQLAADGTRSLLADDLPRPLNGLTFHGGGLYVSAGDQPGRIIRLELDGRQSVILDGLPGPGNYHVNEVAFGPDGKLYFSQGAMTNSGIVGLDAYELGWLRRLPHSADKPGYGVALTGVNVETENPLADELEPRVLTGAFVPFATPTKPGQRIPPQLPATASVMRCDPDGSALELVAWGLRNAWGLGFLADGRLIATDQGADDRGSRPIGNAPDLLYEVRDEGAWYGWPDFIGGEPVTSAEYVPERGPAPTFLLENHDELPPPETPLLRFPPHVAAVKFDIVPEEAATWSGHIIVAHFGDEAPMAAPPGQPRVGRTVARIDPSDWTLHDPFVDGPFRRPIDIRFNPVNGDLYILDFGQFEMHAERGVVAEDRSGRLWRLRL